MFKQIAATFALSAVGLGLSTLNLETVLAQPVERYVDSSSFYPDSCAIALGTRRYKCDELIIGFFQNGSGNIKLCDRTTCLILIVSPSQIRNVANNYEFDIREIAWQKGSEIILREPTRLSCGTSRAGGLGCIGNLGDGSSMAIYVE